MTNVLIVDDERLVRELFTRYIHSASDRYTLVEAIGDASNAEIFCLTGGVDLILMDICTAKGSSGLLAAEKIKKRFPRVKIIIVTSAPEFSFLERAKALGAESFWYKDICEKELIDVMDKTMAGESIYPKRTPEVPIGLASSYEFTPKEMEVLYWLAEVVSTRNIAAKMGISEDGVNEHLKHLKEKTGCASKTELAILTAGARLVLPKY